MYSYNKIIERISPDKISPEKSPQTIRGVKKIVLSINLSINECMCL